LSIEISSTGYINKDDLIAGLTFGWALILILIPVLSGKFSDKLASIYLLTCMGPLFLSVIYSGYLTFKSGVQRRKFVFSDWFSNNSYKAGAGLYVDTNSELWGIVKIIAGLVAVVYLVWDVFPK
jgi:formate/nitrite transporter FocA (FNT family)